MSLGNLSAHFSIYQPKIHQSKEFCEDIPDASHSLFVIEFIHDVLNLMEVEFRIVRDVNNAGLSAQWPDIQAIEDLASATVFYSGPQQYASGTMQLNHEFNQEGGFIGIIEARHTVSGKVYRTVFPFRVGEKTFWDYLPLFIGVLILLELFFWLTNGGLERFYQTRRTNSIEA